MALPKRRNSRSRSRKRRTHYKASAPAFSTCPNCTELKPPHRVCPNCGYYKGRTFKKEEEE
ncbi:MAG TPA: 50S ribosomal protein L32 [Thermodesulfobacteriota bacterium]|nr:50S ribosomal protein L32 [Thermodesulfobacteriota bacterium]